MNVKINVKYNEYKHSINNSNKKQKIYRDKFNEKYAIPI